MTPLPTLPQALQALATSDRGIRFISGESSERVLRYADLQARALGVLRYLQKYGATPGSEVIIIAEGLEPFIDTFWACMLGRIIAVPLAAGNAEEHKAKFFRVMAQLRDPHVATDRRTFDRLRAHAMVAGHGDAIARLERKVTFLDEVADVSKPGDAHPATPEDIAFIQYSSGSTSEPKGITLTHANLAANLEAIITGTGAASSDRSLSWMPLTHDMGLIGFHLAPLCANIDQILMPTSLFVRRPGLWLAKASEHRTTITCSPNFGYTHYLKAHDPARAATLDLSSLRVIFNGAEPIAADLCARFAAALLPSRLPPNVMFPVYGLAEASLAVTFPEVNAPLRTSSFKRGALGPGDRPVAAIPGADEAVTLVHVGKPVRHCEVRIATTDGAAALPGTVGRILIRGANVTQGYYRDPEQSSTVRTADGFLDTGDLGLMVDGDLVITGRSKEILFVSGQNYFPQDIEAVLAEHAGIATGHAAAVAARAAGADADDVVLFVVHKGGDDQAFAQVARNVRRVVTERLGLAIAAVVPIRQLPKTTSGKVQRVALARDFEAGQFDAAIAAIAQFEAVASRTSVPAQGELERSLLAICQAAMPNRKLSPEDNLFEMGTGSLTLAQIYEKVETMYPGLLEVTDFFDYPTVRQMAAFLAERQALPR